MSSETGDWHIVRPEGLALALLCVTVVFSVFCPAIVSVRLWLRWRANILGAEDWLMAAGLALNLVHNGVVIYGSLTGVGTPDSRLNTAQFIQGGMSIVLWQLFYVSSSTLIKSSICTTLIRIADARRSFVYILRGLIALSVASTIVAMIGVFVRCKPMAASWNPSLGTCINQNIIIVLTYVVSGVNIITDFTAAALPMILLWHMQMERRLKIVTGGVLGLGVLASVATIIRIPYSNAYSNTHNQLYNLAYVVLWTVVECSLGIIAGSLPMLQSLFKCFLKDATSVKKHSDSPLGAGSENIDLVTIGRERGRHHPIYDTDFSVTVGGRDELGNERDDSSAKQIINITTSVEQTISGGSAATERT